jgi:hypothetical protein
VSVRDTYRLILNDSVSFPIGLDTARVLGGQLIAIPHEDDELFDLFQDDGVGNPAGDRLVEIGWPALREILKRK